MSAIVHSMSTANSKQVIPALASFRQEDQTIAHLQAPDSTVLLPSLSRNSSYLNSVQGSSSSSRASIISGSAQNTKSSFLDDIRHEVTVNYLYQQQCSRLWVGDGSGELEGVLLKRKRSEYLACPPPLTKSVFAAACAELNLQVAMTVNSRVVKIFLAWSPDATDVPLMNGLRVQILPDIHHLSKARKHQFAAFIASEALLVVWDDEASNLVERAKAIESELMQLVWKTGQPGEDDETLNEKALGYAGSDNDEESNVAKVEDRPTHLMNTILVAWTLIIVITLLGLGCRSIAIEMAVDQGYLRLAFLALVPVQVFFTLVSLGSSHIAPADQTSSSPK